MAEACPICGTDSGHPTRAGGFMWTCGSYRRSDGEVYMDLRSCYTIADLKAKITRAIAKARKYLHPGTNAGDHRVLSEMVQILEGSNTKGE